jgi:2-dehydropantoate 2-reductase
METLESGRHIAVIGAGAIGGFYGVMLVRAGFDVHFLFRGDYDTVAAQGVRLYSEKLGDTRIGSVNAYRDAADMPACDYVIVAAKTTSNDALVPAIRKVATPGARVMLFQNGLGVEEDMCRVLPDSLHVLGGICFVSVHREGPGVIRHHGQGAVHLGYHSGPVADDGPRIVDEACAMFAQAGLDARAVANLARARWEKLVRNIPFNGVSVLLNSGTRALMNHSHTRVLIRELMDEVVAGAAACGHPLGNRYVDNIWAALDRNPDYTPSMLVDFLERRPLELAAIYAAPLAVAAQAGTRMTKVDMLYQTLCFLDLRNRGGM